MSKELTLRIKLATIIMIGIGVGAFFGGYYFATYKQVGYNEGFVNGYTKGVSDLYTFNSQPDKWTTLDKKFGLAMINGTSVRFVWTEGNQTLKIALKSTGNLGVKNERGTLFLMSDPIQIPPVIAKTLNVQQKQYYVFQNEQNQKYLLQLVR